MLRYKADRLGYMHRCNPDPDGLVLELWSMLKQNITINTMCMVILWFISSYIITVYMLFFFSVFFFSFSNLKGKIKKLHIYIDKTQIVSHMISPKERDRRGKHHLLYMQYKINKYLFSQNITIWNMKPLNYFIFDICVFLYF